MSTSTALAQLAGCLAATCCLGLRGKEQLPACHCLNVHLHAWLCAFLLYLTGALIGWFPLPAWLCACLQVPLEEVDNPRVLGQVPATGDEFL